MKLKKQSLSIAVCDGDKAACEVLEHALAEIADELQLDIETDIFYTGNGLRRCLARGECFDILFLSLELEDVSGIQVGEYIRTKLNDQETQIVYLSDKIDHIMRLFRSHPYAFLLKPVDAEELLHLMRQFAQYAEKSKRIFVYQIKRTKYKVLFEQIIYFQSNQRKIILVKTDGKTEFYGKLDEVVRKAPSYFLLIHKSYLLNIRFAASYSYNTIKLKNGERLPVSRAYQKRAREVFREGSG